MGYVAGNLQNDKFAHVEEESPFEGNMNIQYNMDRRPTLHVEDMEEDIAKFRSPDKSGNQSQLGPHLSPAGVEENVTYKNNVQCEDRSVELSLEQAMSFTIDQMTHRVCKIEHLIERAERLLEAGE